MAKVCDKSSPSSFRHRVEVQAVSTTSDGQGGVSESWDTIKTVWASIKPVRAYEKFQAMQLETPITHKITMRFQDGITTAKRLLYGTRIFHIVEVINIDDANVYLNLTCKEIETA